MWTTELKPGEGLLLNEKTLITVNDAKHRCRIQIDDKDHTYKVSKRKVLVMRSHD